MKKLGMQGWTMLEMITVMAIMGILISVAQSSMKEYQLKVRLQSAADMVGADIRNARFSVYTMGEPFHIDFEPAAGSYLVNGANRVKLPAGVKFGSDANVTGKPTAPSEKPPVDGITFKGDGVDNRAEFLPKSLVVPTGAVYLTNGKETMAITVSLNGHTRTWKSLGGKQWQLL